LFSPAVIMCLTTGKGNPSKMKQRISFFFSMMYLMTTQH